jgi:hypothetical protein
MTVAVSSATESCFLGTKTNFCEQFGLICRPGQECAASQAVCINIGGCGNGVVDKGEVCDDGNIVDGEMNADGVFVLDQCSHDCTSTLECGNGIQDRGEQCDHGKSNGTPDDNCDATCHLVIFVCGNGVVDQAEGEQCDPGSMDSSTCNSFMAGPHSCKTAMCGDGYTNTAALEKCDSSGIDTAQCNGKLCTLPSCGDKYINNAAGEQCESSGVDTTTCNGTMAGAVSCHAASCGDGYVNTRFTPAGSTAIEQCDNLGGFDTVTCNGNNRGANGPGSCRVPICGDGYTNAATGEGSLFAHPGDASSGYLQDA